MPIERNDTGKYIKGGLYKDSLMEEYCNRVVLKIFKLIYENQQTPSVNR
jgi:hypothetical protein